MLKKSEIQIFLAHAHEDKEVVFELYDRLKKAGYKPWLDKKDLIPGQNWRSEISRVIKNSQLFVACLSKRSIAKRGFVQKEFRMALNQAAELSSKSIYIIPLRLDECEIPDLQEEHGINLRDYHWLDYSEADGFDKLEKAILHQYGPFAEDQYFIENLGSDVTLEMLAIPGGKFMMGSPEGEGSDYEKPQHEVTVSSFYMGKFLITQVQYQKIMYENPSRFKGYKRPVDCVAWSNAVEFCQRLSEQTGKYYRLPSEAEWEYACRAGTNTPYYFGKTIIDKFANYDNNVGETTPVGIYPPNNFGLYDMSGNLCEWCQDHWQYDYNNAPSDGSAWLSGESIGRVMRGGSWLKFPSFCRSAFREIVDSNSIIIDYGFRVVCDDVRI